MPQSIRSCSIFCHFFTDFLYPATPRWWLYFLFAAFTLVCSDFSWASSDSLYCLNSSQYGLTWGRSSLFGSFILLDVIDVQLLLESCKGKGHLSQGTFLHKFLVNSFRKSERSGNSKFSNRRGLGSTLARHFFLPKIGIGWNLQSVPIGYLQNRLIE